MKAADGTSQVIEGKAVVIATGSDVARLRGVEIDEQRIVSSTGALVLDKVPQRLLVIGAGVVGLAIARALGLRGHSVIVAEATGGIGNGVSSRNSEVMACWTGTDGKSPMARRVSAMRSTIDGGATIHPRRTPAPSVFDTVPR